MDYNFCDPYLFTVGQYARMQNALLVNNTPSGNATTSYTLDAPETAQTAPSNVTATLVNASTNVGNIVSWTDNSSVEMGYIIERATSLTGSYEPIGGVAANIITFTDATPPKNATAYYRVKPSNSKNNYSLIANVSTPLYCGATYSSPCTIGATTASHIIRRFKVATTAPVTLFDNDNSGCSANSYGDYYNTFTANVAAGSTYNFYMNTFYGSNGYFPQHLGIFIDINKDGDFEDAGEQVFRSTGTVMSGTTSLDGTFTVPAGAFNGSTRLRVRCRYNSSEVTAACGSFTSGETEDYKLIITGGLVPVELVDFTAKRANSTVKLYWQTATEHLNKGFQIERSADGVTFENIGFIDGKGDSKALNYYDFTDADPLSINYYRLRQMDFDGTETVSKVVSVFMDKLNELAIYPNPTKDHITIRLHTYNDAFLRVIDVLGREILRKPLLNEASDVDMSQFKSGNYIFEVQLKGQVLREKVVKY